MIVAFGESGQKRQDLIRGDGFQVSFTKIVFESGKQKAIVFYCIFFSNCSCDALDKILLRLTISFETSFDFLAGFRVLPSDGIDFRIVL